MTPSELEAKNLVTVARNVLQKLLDRYLGLLGHAIHKVYVTLAFAGKGNNEKPSSDCKLDSENIFIENERSENGACTLNYDRNIGNDHLLVQP